jgi:hypothetical protein
VNDVATVWGKSGTEVLTQKGRLLLLASGPWGGVNPECGGLALCPPREERLGRGGE